MVKMSADLGSLTAEISRILNSPYPTQLKVGLDLDDSSATRLQDKQ